MKSESPELSALFQLVISRLQGSSDKQEVLHLIQGLRILYYTKESSVSDGDREKWRRDLTLPNLPNARRCFHANQHALLLRFLLQSVTLELLDMDQMPWQEEMKPFWLPFLLEPSCRYDSFMILTTCLQQTLASSSRWLRLYLSLLRQLLKCSDFLKDVAQQLRDEDWRMFVQVVCSLPDRLAPLLLESEDAAEDALLHWFSRDAYFDRLMQILSMSDECSPSLVYLVTKFIRLGRADVVAKYFGQVPGLLGEYLLQMDEFTAEKLIMALFSANSRESITKSLRTCYKEKLHVRDLLQRQLPSILMSSSACPEVCARLVWVVKALGASDGLATLISAALDLWQSPIIIECNSSVEAHRCVNYILMLALQILVSSQDDMKKVVDLVRLALAKAVPYYLDSSCRSVAELGLYVAEEMSKLFAKHQATKSVLQFDMKYESDEPDGLRAFLASELQLSCDTVDKTETKPVTHTSVASNEAYPVDSDSDTDSIQPFETNVVEEETIELSNGKCIRSPRFLRDCIAYLNDRDQESGRDKVEVALKTVESIVLRESMGTLLGRKEINEVGVQLAGALLYLKDHYDESLTEYRIRALTTLAVVSEREVPCYLVHELWYKSTLSLMERLELLTILGEVARRLSSPTSSNTTTQDRSDACIDLIASSANTLAARTRYFHPHSRQLKPKKSEQNALQRSLQHWFVPLVNGFWTTELSWLRSQVGHPPRNHSLTPSLLLSSLSLYDNMESVSEQKLEPFTFLMLTKWIATLALLLNSVGPFDPNLPSYVKLIHEVLEWYCRFASEREVAADEMYPETRILEHPQFRNVVLLVLWTCMRLADTNPALCDAEEIVPFRLVSAVNGSLVMGGLDGLMEWLAVDVIRHDSQEWNRHMASNILGLIKKRLDSVVGVPAEMIN